MKAVWSAPMLALVLGLVPMGAVAQMSPGDIVFKTDFEGTNVLRAWGAERNPHVRLAPGYRSAQCLQIEAPTGTTSHVTVRRPLPVERMRGARLRCEAMVKADGVTPPPQPWNGVKAMLHLDGPTGAQWLQQNNIFGTFNWKNVQFTARVPKEATMAELVLGLEAVHGRASFDDVKITVLTPPRAKPAAPPVGPTFKGHHLPRLRGAMIGTRLTAADLREFGEQWRANHVRWQLLWGGFPHGPADRGDLAAYDAWLEGELKRLDELLPVCAQAGLLVLIDLHTPPGGRNGASQCRLFHEKRFQDRFLAWWDRISRRYCGNKTVWGYDLVNEPVEGTLGEDCLGWQELATAAARIVRRNDPEHAIVVEPEPWGGPEAIENLTPLPVPGVVYSVHFYQPHKFTHQGVYSNPTGLPYPGQIEGKFWDKARLRQALQPVVEFQRGFGVHIYIGEFSAIRWAPDESAFRYLRDCIELFEELGWDWAYHAFREWEGWSVEHGPDPKDRARSKTPTRREQLLRQWFAKNQKPR